MGWPLEVNCTGKLILVSWVNLIEFLTSRDTLAEPEFVSGILYVTELPVSVGPPPVCHIYVRLEALLSVALKKNGEATKENSLFFGLNPSTIALLKSIPYKGLSSYTNKLTEAGATRRDALATTVFWSVITSTLIVVGRERMESTIDKEF